MTTPNTLFGDTLRTLQVAHALNLFNYIRSRSDTDMKGKGDYLVPILTMFRRVPPENKIRYYDIIAPILNTLTKYALAEEQASRSGFYENQRLQSITNVRAAVLDLGDQPDVLELLGYMQTQVYLERDDLLI